MHAHHFLSLFVNVSTIALRGQLEGTIEGHLGA